MVSAFARLLVLAGILAAGLFAAPTASAGPSCTGVNRIDETFANGARWQLCWDVRSREAVVLRELYYTPPGGVERKVMEELSLAQIHVPYDDNGARFHDVTDFGAGGNNLNDLTNADCPGGALLQDGSKDVVCRTLAPRGSGYDTLLGQVQGSQLELWSVSHIGAYNYIPRYHLQDDGAIEVLMGATGQLQRFEYNDPSATDIGWPLDAAADRIGISHIHNYYFRMDFDLGGTANDDIVEQIDVVADGTQSTRVKTVTPFTVESAVDVAPSQLRSWRVRDGAIDNANGHAISYELVPLESGHKDEGPSYEPFTHDDFYVTQYSACEQYASHNSQLLGCGDDLQDFVSGQSLVGADVVAWYGLTFHHIPRDEDESKMHAHWNGFRLEPRDWSDQTPLSVDDHECLPGALDFDTLAIEPFADQDLGGTAAATHEGTTLSLSGNTWKRTTGSYTVGPDTVLEFEFASAEEGEIHTIGFDATNALNDDARHFELWGNQGWAGVGRVAFTPTYSGGGAFQSFSIPVGQTYTGAGMHLVFGNDKDSGTKNNEGRFRCVRIVEPPSPPVWTDPGPQTSDEGDSISLFLLATDPESQPVAYSAVGLPPGLTIDGVTGEVSGSLDYASAGVYAVVATASDGIDSDDQPFPWTVANLNRAPVWNDPGTQNHAEGDAVSMFLSASDPDTDPLSYSATGLPPGLSCDPNTGEVTGSLDYASAGTYSVMATATDGNDPSDQLFEWNVANTNRAPVWNHPGNAQSDEGEAVFLALSAPDPDGDEVSLSANGLPPGLFVDGPNDAIAGTAASGSAGIWYVQIEASDGSLEDTVIVAWTVVGPPVPIPSLPGWAGGVLALALMGLAGRRLRKPAL